jgi:hypothetical protein
VPGCLRIEALGEFAMRPLQVGKPRLKAQHVSLSPAAISISPVTAFGRPFFPCVDLRNEESTLGL